MLWACAVATFQMALPLVLVVAGMRVAAEGVVLALDAYEATAELGARLWRAAPPRP